MLGSKRAQPLGQGHQHEPIMDACSPAPLLPPRGLVSPVPNGQAHWSIPPAGPSSILPWGALHCKNMSQMSQIVSDDQHCLCKAGQWDKVSQCRPPAGSVSESEGPGCCVRRKLLSHDPRCRKSWKRPTSRRPLLLWSAPSGTRDALQEVADVDFQKEERTNFRPTKEFRLIYECARDLYMGCIAFQTSGRITQPAARTTY